MTQSPSFRLSTFLALATASAALGIAESTLFPEVGVIAAVAVAALFIIYRLDDKAESLSISSANLLGIAIALFYAMWAAFRVAREFRVHEFTNLGWQLLTLPLFGPILVLAVPAKLMRAEKTFRDWWMIHAIGLAQIAVAGTIADIPIVLVLIGVYAALGVWSLAEFLRDRSAAGLATKAAMTPEGPKRRLVRALFWTGAAATSAVALFLITPRSSAERLQFGTPRVEIGYNSSQTVDLRRTADLQDNPDPVFEVRADKLDGQPKADFTPPVRWRGTALSRYNLGVWVSDWWQLPTAVGNPENPKDGSWSPPDLGPDAYRLTFTMHINERTAFLADPVSWAPLQPVPVASQCASGLRGWGPTLDGTANFTRTHCGNPRVLPRRYVQYVHPVREADLGPAFQLANKVRSDESLRHLLTNFPLRVRDYTDRLLLNLVEQQVLPAAAIPKSDNASPLRRMPAVYHEAAARAFSQHLANDPEFRYTTKLERIRGDADPISEFLFDSKAGHCERFAAALVMMLRSQGIPAVLVLGFRGGEMIDDERWLVRQRDAHAWVEVLISRPARDVPAGEPAADWHWLSLDPTPDRTNADSNSTEAKSTWTQALDWFNGVFRHYIVNYTPERRDRALRDILEFILSLNFLLAMGGISAAVLLVRWGRRRSAIAMPHSSEPHAWYAQLERALTARGFTPKRGETAREYAASVEMKLVLHPAAAPFADVPRQWIEAYYQMRFGGMTVESELREELRARLDRLVRALAS